MLFCSLCSIFYTSFLNTWFRLCRLSESYLFCLLAGLNLIPKSSYSVRSRRHCFSFLLYVLEMARGPYRQGNLNKNHSIAYIVLSLYQPTWHTLERLYLTVCIFGECASMYGIPLWTSYRNVIHRVSDWGVVSLKNVLSFSCFDVLTNTKYEKPRDFKRVYRGFFTLNQVVL
jgi:hypothetical protein